MVTLWVLGWAVGVLSTVCSPPHIVLGEVDKLRVAMLWEDPDLPLRIVGRREASVRRARKLSGACWGQTVISQGEKQYSRPHPKVPSRFWVGGVWSN